MKFLIQRKNQIITSLILALFSALSFIACLKFAQNLDYTLRTDALNYHTTAINLIEKSYFGYLSDVPNAYITPLYPLFLALIYKIFGSYSIFNVQIIQSLLFIASGILTYFIIKMVVESSMRAERSNPATFKINIFAIFGACVFLSYPPFISAAIQLLTETLYVFFFLLYLFFVIKYLVGDDGNRPDGRTKARPYINITAGALFAIAALIRPTLFPLLFLPYLIALLQQMYEKKRFAKANQQQLFIINYSLLIKDFLWYSLAITLIMLPWWLRNIIVLGEFIPLATQGGNPLLHGTFPYMNGIETYVLPANTTETAAGISRIIGGFLAQPLLYLKWFTIGKFNMIFYNIWYYLPGDGFAQGIPYFNDFLKIIHYGIVSLGFTGIIYGLFNKKMLFISAFTILIICAHLLVIPTERYAITIIPLLIIASCWLLSRIKNLNE